MATPAFSPRSRLQSFRFAWRGLRIVIASQHNAWIHAVATAVVVAVGLWLGIGIGEWIGIVLAVVSVWIAEILNTAFERLCDVVSPELHPGVESAKDIAAAAVLIAAIGAATVGGLVFGPHLLCLWDASRACA
ncbi:MAG: diacylglycerol kinase [bacterium]